MGVGRPIPDNQSGYRLVSRRIMEATLESAERGFEFEVEMITTCIRLGGTIAWVPIGLAEPSHIRPSPTPSFTDRARRERCPAAVLG